jgi:hypothetical protein
MLIAEKGGLTNSPLELPLNSSDRPFEAAVDALMLLDNGNRMIDKCTAFLDRLSYVLSSISGSLLRDNHILP